jgi:hypothetical protein
MGGRRMLNLCANNYLGLADDPRLIAAAERAMASHGYGMASVRFICGTQDIHRALERRLAEYLGHGGGDPVRRLFRRQWRGVRAAAGAGGCGGLGQL